MCERIHQGYTDGVDAVLINAGAWTHYSDGIRDALAVLDLPYRGIAHVSCFTARDCVPPVGVRGNRRRARSQASAWTAIRWPCAPVSAAKAAQK